ncbi:hypothetical protein BgiMline_028684 [Biomphalaria glabrata]
METRTTTHGIQNEVIHIKEFLPLCPLGGVISFTPSPSPSLPIPQTHCPSDLHEGAACARLPDNSVT